MQADQAYQSLCSQDSAPTLESHNSHYYTYHVAQASQSQHVFLVDIGDNGGLVGSDVRIPPGIALSLELKVMNSNPLMWSNVQPL